MSFIVRSWSCLPVPVRLQELRLDLLLYFLNIFLGRKQNVEELIEPRIGVFEIAHVMCVVLRVCKFDLGGQPFPAGRGRLAAAAAQLCCAIVRKAGGT
jgi:hypothetical protein